MFSTILLICLCYVTDFSDTHRPMPLKDCQSRSKDVLFIIDCRSEVKEQIEVVQSAIFYLSKDRDDKNISHSFMSFSVTGLIQTNNLTEIQNVQPMCNKKLPINDIFNASALWFTSRKKPLVTISFISDTTEPPLSDDVKAIVQIQKKEKKVDRLFIIPDRDGDSKRVFHKVKFLYYYALSHDLNRNIVDIFARICKKMCKKLPATFTSGHFMTSYYHIADVYNMSYDQSVQYCAKRTNSYLVSLESSQEISFLFDYLNKSFAAKDFHKTDLRIHIGIAKHKESWSSGNPFVYLKNFSSNHGSIVPWSNEECYFLNISSLEHIDLMDKTIESFMKNLISNTCSEIVEPSLVICECHDILSNPSSIHNISNAASSNKNVIFGPYLEDFVGDVQSSDVDDGYRDCPLDMGIPEYYKLETLYIENIEMTNISENFFRGLTINSELRASDYKLCCPQILNPNISADKCHAPVDAISSCKHLVGDVLKRITIWTVGLITLVANGIVLVYRIGWNREIFKKAYELFVTGLGVSDFIMGMYLMLIAAVDIQYSDIYVLEDVKWRHSHWCHFAGFLSTLSSETSTFFICLITTDRFLKTTYPHGQHRFTKTGKYVSFTLVWLISFLLAAVPIVSKDWNIYSTNGLCLALPLITTDYDGWVFSFIVFVVLNFALFLFIVMGQILIFTNFNSKRSVHSIKRNSRRRLEDLSVARKLAFVALTDFMCWFPVALLGILSLSGYIFDREVYAWIAVFVLPINSALNPIIYTIPVIYKKFLSSKISF
nr:G-protein coupled receptor [Biomphalaria glabrata]